MAGSETISLAGLVVRRGRRNRRNSPFFLSGGADMDSKPIILSFLLVAELS
jgi:hypothetical protein